MIKTNQSLLDELTDAQRAAVLDGSDAVRELDDFRRKTFELWMRIARGVAALCIVADRPGMSRKARRNMFRDNGYASLNGGTVSRLLRMAEHETAIRVWRDTLTANKRDSWNSPTSICNRCPVVRQAIAAALVTKPRKPRPSNSAVALARALDTIGDYLVSVEDADHRAAVVERLMKLAPAPTLADLLQRATLLALALPEADRWDEINRWLMSLGQAGRKWLAEEASEASKAAKAKPQGLTFKLEEPGTKRPKVTKPTLQWTEQPLGKAFLYIAATARGGAYFVTPVKNGQTKASDYMVDYHTNLDGQSPGGTNITVIAEYVKTAEQAKALAQADFDERAKAKPATSTALVWKQSGTGLGVNYSARANDGQYHFGISLDGFSGKVNGYSVGYIAKLTGNYAEDLSTTKLIGGYVKTAKQAKAIAQADFDKRTAE